MKTFEIPLEAIDLPVEDRGALATGTGLAVPNLKADLST